MGFVLLFKLSKKLEEQKQALEEKHESEMGVILLEMTNKYEAEKVERNYIMCFLKKWNVSTIELKKLKVDVWKNKQVPL